MILWVDGGPWSGAWALAGAFGSAVMSERIMGRLGLTTPGEDAAWGSLRERVTISLRPIGGPTAIGFFGLAAATVVGWGCLWSCVALPWCGPLSPRDGACWFRRRCSGLLYYDFAAGQCMTCPDGI